MKKLSVCVLFGGVSPEHEVSLRSAEFVLNSLDHEKFNVFPVGITREGDWILYGGTDYAALPTQQWLSHPENRRAALSPIRGQGLLIFEGDCVIREMIEIVFPVLHGENGEDGTVQGLLQLAGIPYVGPHVAASAVSMDKTLTKLVVDQIGQTQAAWHLVRRGDLTGSSFTYYAKPENVRWSKREDGTIVRRVMKIDYIGEMTIASDEAYRDTTVNAREVLDIVEPTPRPNNEWRAQVRAIRRKTNIF